MTYSYTNSAGANNGNVTTLDSTATQIFLRTYTYDSLNRLATMSSPSDASGCYGLSWTYDRYGNRTAQNATSGNCLQPQTPVNPNNRLQPPYQYDASGNMTADAVHTYFYDAESRLIQVGGTLGNCSTATACYVYDAEGQRLEKLTGGTTTAYLRNSKGEVVAETDGGNSLLRAGYVYAGGALLAEYENGTTNFVLKDHLGDTRVMTTYSTTAAQNAQVYDSMDYLPYGEQIAGGTGTTHKFTGKERDAESGLDDFDARYYSSSLGRFISADWSATPTPVPYANFRNPQSLNLYAYVKNNPFNLTDPSGHCTADGETHGSVWCALHWAGITSTAKEKAAVAAQAAKQEADWQAYRQSEVNAGRPDPKYVGGAAMFAYGGAMGVVSDLLAEPAPVSPTSPTASDESTGEIVAQNGTKVKGFTKHGVDRMVGDGTADRAGTTPEAILDALKNPQSIESGVDSQGRPSQAFIGKDAKVVVNPQTGYIITVMPLSGKGAH